MIQVSAMDPSWCQLRLLQQLLWFQSAELALPACSASAAMWWRNMTLHIPTTMRRSAGDFLTHSFQVKVTVSGHAGYEAGPPSAQGDLSVLVSAAAIGGQRPARACPPCEPYSYCPPSLLSSEAFTSSLPHMEHHLQRIATVSV